MGTKAVDQLGPGDNGWVLRSAFVGGADGNRYLLACATVHLGPFVIGMEEAFVEVTDEDHLVVLLRPGAAIPVVPPPEEGDEELVLVDALEWMK